MTGYVIFYVEGITDQEQLDRYKKAARPTIGAAGGKAAIVYGRQEVVEGAPLTGVVMIEFPTYEEAQAWYHSPAYQQVKGIRDGATVTHAVIVEGVPKA